MIRCPQLHFMYGRILLIRSPPDVHLDHAIRCGPNAATLPALFVDRAPKRTAGIRTSQGNTNEGRGGAGKRRLQPLLQTPVVPGLPNYIHPIIAYLGLLSSRGHFLSLWRSFGFSSLLVCGSNPCPGSGAACCIWRLSPRPHCRFNQRPLRVPLALYPHLYNATPSLPVPSAHIGTR